jgi:hypothetical protein
LRWTVDYREASEYHIVFDEHWITNVAEFSVDLSDGTVEERLGEW